MCPNSNLRYLSVYVLLSIASFPDNVGYSVIAIIIDGLVYLLIAWLFIDLMLYSGAFSVIDGPSLS